jgi:hypothetical protein
MLVETVHIAWGYGQTNLVDSIRLIVVDDADFASISKIKHVAVLNIHHISNWKRYFHAIAVVVGSENDALQTLHPLLRACRAVCAEVIGATISDESEVHPIFVLLRDRGRDGVPQVDTTQRVVQAG